MTTSSHGMQPASILYSNSKSNPFSFRGLTQTRQQQNPYYEAYNDEVLRHNRNICGVSQTRTVLSNQNTIKNAKQITSRPSTQQETSTPHKLGSSSVHITKTTSKNAPQSNNYLL